MKKQIKFYFHHDHFDEVEYKVRPTGSWWKRALTFTSDLIFDACYFIGLIVVQSVVLPYRFIKSLRNLPDQLQNIKVKFPVFRRSISIFASFAIIIGIIMSGAGLVASGQQLKGRVLGASDDGLSYLNEAKDALQQQDVARADKNFTEALQRFENSEKELHSTGLILQGLMAVIPQTQDANNLLEAVQLVTQAGQNAAQAYAITQQLQISQEGVSGPDAEAKLKQLQSLINTSADKVEAASELMAKVNPLILPSDKQAVFITAKDSMQAMKTTLQTLREGTSLLFDIVLGQKKLLLVFQNNNELRATGGFMGTIGTADFANGQIKHLDIRTVYDFDGQLQEMILPPQPMYLANNRWYLRDSNWFADFPTSASRMIVMYEKEGGETPDLVMAMTPDLIIDLLRRTGPLSMPQYGVTLTAENFVETIQTATSITYDKTLNQPKQLLADFFPMLLQQLSKTEKGGLFALLESLQTSLYQKNVLLCSRNPDLQNKINAFNWGGKIRETDRDYLSVVSSNLTGTKTDRFLVRKIELTSEISTSGIVTNTLNYTISNPLPKDNGLTNTSFVRFLVPKGSKLKEVKGFDKIDLPRVPDTGYQRDSVINEWESSLGKDAYTGTYYGEEAGKSMFANWLKVSGGETKTITLKYQLPFVIRRADRLSLMMQKQPGTNASLRYETIFEGRESVWQNFKGEMQEGKIIYQTDLTKDIFLGQVLQDK